MNDAQELVARFLAWRDMGVTDWWDNVEPEAGHLRDADMLLGHFHDTGLQVVPTSLVTNGQALLDDLEESPVTWAPQHADAFAASVAEARGDSGLEIFAGKP